MTADGHQYTIYTNGDIEGFEGEASIFNCYPSY